jgi:hypothetical protein
MDEKESRWGCLPETKRLLQGSAVGRAAGGSIATEIETENSRRIPARAAAAAIAMMSRVRRVRRDGPSG